MGKTLFIFSVLLGYRSFAQNIYVLVHGAFADYHVWDNVRPLLEASGNKVVVVNLPGHGADTTDPHVLRLASYVGRVVDSIKAQKGRVILVGHSMAGMVISEVAEEIPDRIKCLVYVAAYLPYSGQSLRSLSSLDTGSLVGRNFTFSADYSTARMKDNAAADIICADCPASVKAGFASYLKAEPLAPFGDTVSLSAQRFGLVTKYYLFTTEDRSITYPFQQYMVRMDGSVWKEFTMRTSHLPFVVRLREFMGILLKIGRL